ncbi:MAG: methyltransferase domain-containing protein [Rudaea sp.]
MRLNALLFTTGLLFAASSSAADVYDDAVAHAGRSDNDLKRDANDKPADVLRFSGIKPGMHVADFLAANGYYSELISFVVGDKGHVDLLNNKGYDDFSGNKWKDRIENHHLANVEHRTVDTAHMGLKDNSLDAIFLIKAYHDLYWVDDKEGWTKIDVSSVLNQFHKALKPGGVIIVEDHSAKPGTGKDDAGSLHRIDEAFAKKDFETHGFTFVKSSDIFRRPDDKRDEITYKGPAVGKTDRFLYLFRKPAS